MQFERLSLFRWGVIDKLQIDGNRFVKSVGKFSEEETTTTNIQTKFFGMFSQFIKYISFYFIDRSTTIICSGSSVSAYIKTLATHSYFLMKPVITIAL